MLEENQQNPLRRQCQQQAFLEGTFPYWHSLQKADAVDAQAVSCICSASCYKHRGKCPEHSATEQCCWWGHLFFTKSIWARKVTVLALPSSPMSIFSFSGSYLHVEEKGGSTEQNHWFFPVASCTFLRGELCKGSIQVLCTGSTKSSKYGTEACFVRSAWEKCFRATRVSKLLSIGRFIPHGILGTVRPS